MCGRFSFLDSEDFIIQEFSIANRIDLKLSYNIAPTQHITTVVMLPDGSHVLQNMIWDFKPTWMKDTNKPGFINARLESIAERPSFKHAFKKHRCLILVSGFYEWHKDTSTNTKQAYYIHRKNHTAMALAGLWEHSISHPNEACCCIVTCEANAFMQQVHHRMPVIIARTQYDAWLSLNEISIDAAKHAIDQFTDRNYEMYPVSSYVNNPKNNDEHCIRKVSS